MRAVGKRRVAANPVVAPVIFQVHPRRISGLFVGSHTSIKEGDVECGRWIGSDFDTLAPGRLTVMMAKILEEHDDAPGVVELVDIRPRTGVGKTGPAITRPGRKRTGYRVARPAPRGEDEGLVLCGTEAGFIR